MAGRFCVLLTDFPPADPYVGVLKGVLHRGAPAVVCLDLAHGLPQGDVTAAALVLESQAGFFPAESLFLCVVDPGVGTARRILAARAGGFTFIGPDNGLLVPALRRFAGPGGPEVVAVAVEAVRLPTGTEVFHGRDVMAPAAVRCLRGAPLTALGAPCGDPVELRLPGAVPAGDGHVGEVLYVDGFGNLVTSLEEAHAPPGAAVELAGRPVGPVRRTYGEVAPGEPVALVGSFGRLEVAVRDGSAAARFGARRGTPVRVRRR